jgi:hypothetical protein
MPLLEAAGRRWPSSANLRQTAPLTVPRFEPTKGQEFESPMELRTEKPEITAKNYLSVGPGEYPCGYNLYLIVTPSGGRRWAFRYQRNGIVEKDGSRLGKGSGP